MAAPFDLTLPQAVAVASAIDAARAALSAAIMDSIDPVAVDAMETVHAGLGAQQNALVDLIEATRPATTDENEQRAAYLIRRAVEAGESFAGIAGMAIDAARQDMALRASTDDGTAIPHHPRSEARP